MEGFHGYLGTCVQIQLHMYDEKHRRVSMNATRDRSLLGMYSNPVGVMETTTVDLETAFPSSHCTLYSTRVDMNGFPYDKDIRAYSALNIIISRQSQVSI